MIRELNIPNLLAGSKSIYTHFPGTADSRAIGQILGYIGDLISEYPGKKIRGILVAHDFDTRTKSARKAIAGLELKKYSIEFKFTQVE
jgi:endonuclease